MPPFPWDLAWTICWTVVALAWVCFSGWLVWLVWSETLDSITHRFPDCPAKGDRHGTHTTPPEPPAEG